MLKLPLGADRFLLETHPSCARWSCHGRRVSGGTCQAPWTLAKPATRLRPPRSRPCPCSARGMWNSIPSWRGRCPGLHRNRGLRRGLPERGAIRLRPWGGRRKGRQGQSDPALCLGAGVRGRVPAKRHRYQRMDPGPVRGHGGHGRLRRGPPETAAETPPRGGPGRARRKNAMKKTIRNEPGQEVLSGTARRAQEWVAPGLGTARATERPWPPCGNAWPRPAPHPRSPRPQACAPDRVLWLVASMKSWGGRGSGRRRLLPLRPVRRGPAPNEERASPDEPTSQGDGHDHGRSRFPRRPESPARTRRRMLQLRVLRRRVPLVSGHFPRKMIRYAQIGAMDLIWPTQRNCGASALRLCTRTCPRGANPGEVVLTLKRHVLAAWRLLMYHPETLSSPADNVRKTMSPSPCPRPWSKLVEGPDLPARASPCWSPG
jgi:hypothetical protein